MTTTKKTNVIEHYTSQKTQQQLQKLESKKTNSTIPPRNRKTEAALPERFGPRRPPPRNGTKRYRAMEREAERGGQLQPTFTSPSCSFNARPRPDERAGGIDRADGHFRLPHTQCKRNARPLLHVYSSDSSPSSPPAAALLAARLRATRPGRPWPYGEVTAKSMCFSASMRTMNWGTFTSCLPTLLHAKTRRRKRVERGEDFMTRCFKTASNRYQGQKHHTVNPQPQTSESVDQPHNSDQKPSTQWNTPSFLSTSSAQQVGSTPQNYTNYAFTQRLSPHEEPTPKLNLPDVAVLDQHTGVVDRLGQTLLENLSDRENRRYDGTGRDHTNESVHWQTSSLEKLSPVLHLPRKKKAKTREKNRPEHSLTTAGFLQKLEIDARPGTTKPCSTSRKPHRSINSHIKY